MGLAQKQQVLAKLYTDSILRERFFADPQPVGKELGLGSDEVQQLAQLSPEQVSFFANSLQRKRLNEACKLLPLTHRVLGGRFANLFRQYANSHVPKGTKKHQEDAIAFCAFIEKVARVDHIDPPWVVELVRYEAAWLEAVDPTCRWTLRWFRHPMSRLVAGLVRGDEISTPSRRPTIALWFRLSRQGRLRHVTL